VRAGVEAFRPPYEPREIVRPFYQFGYRSAPLILTAGMAIGVVLSMHTRASLERFGAESMIPAALAIALIRETGPLTAGLLVSGRVGAGIGAEIGRGCRVRDLLAPVLRARVHLHQLLGSHSRPPSRPSSSAA
jgi:phospholipid/cholesterol/gamma-HCH transport system permease protein